MFGASQPGLAKAVDALVIASGLISPTPRAQPTEVAQLATNTPFEPGVSADQMDPSRTPFPSRTPSVTATITDTPTETQTATETLTPTASATSTASLTATMTASATPYPTWTPSNTPRPSATYTQAPSLTPSSTPVPPTEDTNAPTATPSDTPAPTPTNTSSSCETSLNTSYEATIEDLINEARSNEGLAPLAPQSQLRSAARIHATDMACNGFTGHTGSDGSSVADRVEAQGYEWSWIGENYMVTNSGPEAAFNWWMDSDPHRDNILGSAYTEFGVGYIYSEDSDYGGYYVVVFARPG
ncbi:MAG: CAP domain-containing protein [Anaerolineales bacterium]